MERRKSELERKKLKLAELKRNREERKQALLSNQKEKLSSSKLNLNDKKEIDSLVASLVGDKSSKNSTPSMSLSISEPTPSLPMNYHHQIDQPSQIVSPTSPNLDPNPLPPSISSRFIPEFSITESVIFEFIPKEKVYYNKEAQTNEVLLENQNHPESLEDEETIQENTQKLIAKEKEEWLKYFEEQMKLNQTQIDQNHSVELKKLDENEKRHLLETSEFHDFIDHSSRVVERALSEPYDFLKDYSITYESQNESNNDISLKYVCQFYDDRFCKNRYVTDVDWSKKYPELVLSSYNKNPLTLGETDGLVCVWNLHLLDRPEYLFTAQSDVLTAKFSEFHPNLIVGGTYSGQILLWDTRSKSLPVSKTPLSTIGHTHPIFSLKFIGTQNAHNLISASTDGLVCSWQLDMLSKPQEILELLHPNHYKTEEISVTCFDFPDSETTTFWVGSEEGNVYQANRYDRAGNKAGVNHYDTYQGHFGPITNLDFHPLFGPVDFSDLFLTCSVDWTIKLWRAKSPSKPSTAPLTITPLLSFESSDDYIYDVKWSPSNPAIFGSIDGNGKFDLWNLNFDMEVPLTSSQIGTSRALTRFNWDREGKKIGIGSSDSHLYIHEIGEIASPTNDDFFDLQKMILGLSPQTLSK